MISCARKMMSTVCSKASTSNAPSGRRNFMRFSDARLHALSSTCMYSEHGFDALMRPEFGDVCHWLIVVSYWTPGSAQRHAASAILRMSSRAGMGSPIGSPVLPPDLIVPAHASAPRMKETGPLAVPPLLSGSIDPRMFERLMPEPEPPRKMSPSLVFQSRIDSMLSSTLRMKQAEHCGESSKPTLNQTGELNAAIWWSRTYVSSASKLSPSS